MLLTGGTGFVGSHVAEALLARGARVRALVRDPRRLRWLAGIPAEIVPGDVCDPASLRRAAAGCARIVHAAGILRALDIEGYRAVNRDGTRNVARAARAAGVERLLYLSSLAAAGPSRPGRPRVEDDPEAPISDYGLTKLEGESEVRAAGVPFTIIRPPAVFGPRDRDLFLLFRLVRSGFAPRIGRRRREVSLAYAPDLARTIAAALDSPSAEGETFFVGDETPCDDESIARTIEAALGRRALRLAIPESAARLVGAIGDVTGRLAGRAAVLNGQKVREILAPGWRISTARIRARLGIEAPTPLGGAFRETARWYVENGWLRGASIHAGGRRRALTPVDRAGGRGADPLSIKRRTPGPPG
ncbi:MAG: NAD-dependent epimerase/dehydratase family protein [Planctomycetes bacterium]|nr:NAD-dependent epimerase/dehydratase family protein [Planctomycetota bacterium]